jgi:hypothetical protein
MYPARCRPHDSARSTGATVVFFVGVQDDDLTGIRRPSDATIREALNAAQRDANCISVVAVGSVRHAAKASLNALNFAGSLDKPVARVSHSNSPASCY